MLNICLVFTDASGEYYRHPMTALASVFENTKSRVRAHFLVDATVAEQSRRALESLCGRYGHEAVFYQAPEIPARVLKNVRPCFGIGALFRLFIQDLIREDMVLYLDCDIICTTDIADIFAHDMSGSCLGGVPDAGLCREKGNREYLRGIGADPDRYINGGVMLMHLKRLREVCPDFREDIYAMIEARNYAYMEQDAMNIYFRQKGEPPLLLPEKFDFLIGVEDRAYLPLPEYEDKVLHYTRDKPWKALYPAAFFYWKYYAAAFSAEEAFTAMEKLGRHEHEYLYGLTLRHPTLRRTLKRLFDIERQGVWSSALDRLFPGRRKRMRT